MFGYDQPIQLNLLDIEPAMGVLGGVCMEIDDCALPLVTKVVATADPNVAFKVLNHSLLPVSITNAMHCNLCFDCILRTLMLLSWLEPCPARKVWRGKTSLLAMSKSSRSKDRPLIRYAQNRTKILL